MMLYRMTPKFAGICGLIALCAFIATFNWIAFGPGERNFTKSTSFSGPVVSSSVSSGKKQTASETEGRLVFGIFAGAMDALILFGFYKVFMQRNAGRRGISPGDVPPTKHPRD